MLFLQHPELLQAFRRGERRALETVYWAYVDRVERLIRYGFYVAGKDARVQGARPDEVADLVQEVFARALSERARLAFDGLRDYGPYLGSIARNLLVDWARKQGRELPIDDAAIDLDGSPPEVRSRDEAPWMDPATLRVVSRYLEQLAPELRVVHELRYGQGLPQQAAAAALGISRQKLRTREEKLRRGLALELERAGIPHEK